MIFCVVGSRVRLAAVGNRQCFTLLGNHLRLFGFTRIRCRTTTPMADSRALRNIGGRVTNAAHSGLNREIGQLSKTTGPAGDCKH